MFTLLFGSETRVRRDRIIHKIQADEMKVLRCVRECITLENIKKI
jgi:hypothetical protein